MEETGFWIVLTSHLGKEKRSSNSYMTGSVLHLVHNQFHGPPQSSSPRNVLIWTSGLSREMPRDFRMPCRITWVFHVCFLHNKSRMWVSSILTFRLAISLSLFLTCHYVGSVYEEHVLGPLFIFFYHFQIRNLIFGIIFFFLKWNNPGSFERGTERFFNWKSLFPVFGNGAHLELRGP